jgi:hypothetical protein
MPQKQVAAHICRILEIAALIFKRDIYFGFGIKEPISDTTVWDSSLRFSAKTCIRMRTRITQTASAISLPTTGNKQKP